MCPIALVVPMSSSKLKTLLIYLRTKCFCVFPIAGAIVAGWPNVTDVTSAVMPCRQPSRQAILTRPLPPQPPPPPPAKANEGGIVLIKQAVPAISTYFSAFLHK